MRGGGGGIEEIWRNVCCHKSKKKMLKMSAGKKFVDGIDENIVAQNKLANQKIDGNIKNKKVCLKLNAKKDLFSCRGKEQ